MTDKNDILVKQFMAENRRDIPENGFSKTVLKHLPDDMPFVLSRRWTILCWCLCLLTVFVLFITGNLHFSIHVPEMWLNILRDLQSLEAVSRFLIGNLRYAMLSWFVLLAGALTFAYHQYRAA